MYRQQAMIMIVNIVSSVFVGKKAAFVEGSACIGAVNVVGVVVGL